jgi:hypothetical protein
MKTELSNKEFFKKLLYDEIEAATKVAKILNNLPPTKYLRRTPVNPGIYKVISPSSGSNKKN